MANAHDRDGVIANIAVLVGNKSRGGTRHLGATLRRHMPPGSDGWQHVPELIREASEPLIHKRTATPSKPPTWRPSWPSGRWDA
jgi:hypothetical protein